MLNLSEKLSPDDVPRLIRELYTIVAKFERIFEGRHFTPDGHLVGSIGEAIASYYYGVQLNKASTSGFDGERDGCRVEVKTTQKIAVAFSGPLPAHLLVFKLHPSGDFDECYNGPGQLISDLIMNKKFSKNGQRRVSLTTLRGLMSKVDANQYLEPVRCLPETTRRVGG